MSEFLPNTDPVRPVTAVPQVTPRADAGHDVMRRPAPVRDAAATAVLSHEDAARAFGTYSKVQTQIADVVADLGTQGVRKSPAMLAQAENTLLSLLPQPSVVLPLPPADEDMVAFVALVTQSIARQVAQTRAAVSHVAPATVDAATA